MSIKSFAAKLFAKKIVKKTKKWSAAPIKTQERVFKKLIATAKDTQFGKDHDFDQRETNVFR